MYHKHNPNFAPRTFGGIIEDIFNNGIGRLVNDDFWNDKAQVPVNITERDHAFEMQVVAPGISKEAFRVQVDKNVLTVSFEQKEENKEEQPGKVLRHEYKVQSFKRSFTLNEKIDSSRIGAKYDQGILYLSLPKREQAENTPQQIRIG